MAKKDKKKKEKDAKSAETDAVAALRSAFERTFSASAEGAQATRERTREIVDEIAAAAGRVRHTLEDMRVLDEVKKLRSEVEALAARVASLELPRGGSAKSVPAKPAAVASAGAKPAAKRARTKKPAAARKATARKPAAAKKPAATRKRAAKKPAAKSAASTPEAKPAASS